MDNILEKIYKSGLKFLDPLSTEETYSIIVEEAKKLVNAENASMFLEQEGLLERVYATDPRFMEIKIRPEGHTFTAFKHKKAYVRTIKIVGKIHPELKKIGVKSVIFIPLSYKNKSIGVLTVQAHDDQKFSNKELNILKLFGSMASLSIRKTQLYEETKKALDTRDLFISMASHELRTPLTAISGYIQLLRARLAKSDTTESRWVEQLYWECIRMTNLVKELLEINRIRSGQLNYEWKECSIKEIVERAVTNFRFSYPDREIVIKDELDSHKAKVIGDFDKILQVITNLIDNAIKFSSEDTPITLKLTYKNKYLILLVEDEGIGISSKDKKKMFDGFFRGNNHQREGMGLGLFLAKDIISRHHGNIGIHSKKGGTTIEVKLPQIMTD